MRKGVSLLEKTIWTFVLFIYSSRPSLSVSLSRLVANDTEDKEHLAFLRLLGEGLGRMGAQDPVLPSTRGRQ